MSRVMWYCESCGSPIDRAGLHPKIFEHVKFRGMGDEGESLYRSDDTRDHDAVPAKDAYGNLQEKQFGRKR